MKKFLVFLVSLVVVVCVGLTTYYFMRNNEIITIETKEIYCNSGDLIPLNSLGINIKNANISKKTTFDYNAGGEEVTDYIKYNAESGAFEVSQTKGGEVTLVIRTSNKKYSDFTINVHIGNGSTENPYYIFNESELSRIGSVYRLDKNYILMNDISLTSNFKPIGFNSNTNSWETFNGTFDGGNHAINNLSLTTDQYLNAGFFSTLGANATVKNLTINGANISGAYANAGVLAGVSNGNVEKVVVKNSNITNLKNDSITGSIIGKNSSNVLKMSYAENVILTAGTEETPVFNATVGGLVGTAIGSTIQACYTNGVEIKSSNANIVAGGFVGEYAIGNQEGSIQQSYANSTSALTNYGAFIGKISTLEGFDATQANLLRYLIGNIAVVGGRDSSANIVDSDVVKTYDSTFFKNTMFENNQVFYDKDSALYMIRGFIGAGEIISTNEFIYYAVDTSNLTNWDTEYIWNVENNSLPTLRMFEINPSSPSSEYLRRDLELKELANKVSFLEVFASNVANENIKLSEDVDLTAGWTPVSITNTTIDGNGKTITINLNNAVDSNLGLFTVIDNSVIKNLNIVVTGVSANSTNGGALAGTITSSDNLTVSSIENVVVTYQNNFATPTITYFGGLAGVAEKTIISDSKVEGLIVNADSQLQNAGGVAGELKALSDIKNSEINVTIFGTTFAGGVVGVNNGNISSVSGVANVKYNQTINDARVGGVAGLNNGTVDNVALTISLSVEKAGTNFYVGGVAGLNAGTISNTTISGEKIELQELNSYVYVGGVSAVNDGTIENVNNNIVNIGSYYVGKTYFVGGVSAINNGKIVKVLTQSNIYGNYVSGIAYTMEKSEASVDQVVVAKFIKETNSYEQNELKADKYLAGAVAVFKAGKVTNVQLVNNINGTTNSTRSSLIALIFPYGTILTDATVNSQFSGYGINYRETWTDFGAYSNPAEFGYTYEKLSQSFNLYGVDTYHGSMQDIVINVAQNGVASAKAAMGDAAILEFMGNSYNKDSGCYIKVVYGFNDVTQFQGSFTFVCSTWKWREYKVTKTLDFDLVHIWESNNGISMRFIHDLVA